MSLFGDSHSPDLTDASPRQGSAEGAQDDNAVDLLTAQAPQDFDAFIEDELENTSDVDQRDTDVQDDPDIDRHDRLNRFEGTAAQWRHLTKEERGLASSLDELRDADLSSHLYNAYALKRNARRSSAYVSAAGSPDDDGHITRRDGSKKEREWTPGATWTAWPMPPDLVPHPQEHSGIISSDSLSGDGLEGPSLRPIDELRQQLQSLLQTQAKEQWMTDGGSVNPSTISQTAELATEAGSGPTVLTDDDEAQQILQPTVNSVLAKIDRLLLALHHSRKGTIGVAETLLRKRDRSVDSPSRASNAQSITQLGGRSRSRDDSGSAPRDRAVSKPGRPKTYDKRDGESYYQMQKRLAHERSRARGTHDMTMADARRLPEDGYYYGMYKRLAQGPQEPQQRRTARERSRSTSLRRLPLSGNPRDWSEVLNLAAQQGFSAEVVRRAADRCSKLFDEQMLLRSIPAASRPGLADATIPVDQTALRHERPPDSMKRTKRQRMASDAELQLTCPIQTCPWHMKRFAGVRLRDGHVLKAHGPEVVTQSSVEEVLVDGVHMDGYLQVIPQ